MVELHLVKNKYLLKRLCWRAIST